MSRFSKELNFTESCDRVKLPKVKTSKNLQKGKYHLACTTSESIAQSMRWKKTRELTRCFSQGQ